MTSQMATKKKLMDALVAKLLDLHPPPKARQAYQQFMHDSWETLVKPCIAERWGRKVLDEQLPSDAKPDAAFRMKVARDMFNALPQAERYQISQKAKVKAASAKAVYESALNGRPSTEPDVMQRAIHNIPEILDATMMSIQRTTNFKVTVIYGGPDPHDRKKEIVRCAVYGADPHRPELPPIHIPQYNPKRFKKLIRHLQQVAEERDAPHAPGDKQASKHPEEDAAPEVIDLTESTVQEIPAPNGIGSDSVDVPQEVETLERPAPEHPKPTYTFDTENFVNISPALETPKSPPSIHPEPGYNVDLGAQQDIQERVTGVPREVEMSNSPAPLRSEPTYKLGLARWDDVERMAEAESPPMNPVAEDLDICTPFHLELGPPTASVSGRKSEKAKGKEREKNVPVDGALQTRHVQGISPPSPRPPVFVALDERPSQPELNLGTDDAFPGGDPAPVASRPLEPQGLTLMENAPSAPSSLPPPSKKRKRRENSEQEKTTSSLAGNALAGGSTPGKSSSASTSTVNPPAPKKRKQAPKAKKDGVKPVKVRNIFERGKWFWMEVSADGHGYSCYDP